MVRERRREDSSAPKMRGEMEQETQCLNKGHGPGHSVDLWLVMRSAKTGGGVLKEGESRFGKGRFFVENSSKKRGGMCWILAGTRHPRVRKSDTLGRAWTCLIADKWLARIVLTCVLCMVLSSNLQAVAENSYHPRTMSRLWQYVLDTATSSAFQQEVSQQTIHAHRARIFAAGANQNAQTTLHSTSKNTHNPPPCSNRWLLK